MLLLILILIQILILILILILTQHRFEGERPVGVTAMSPTQEELVQMFAATLILRHCRRGLLCYFEGAAVEVLVLVVVLVLVLVLILVLVD